MAGMRLLDTLGRDLRFALRLMRQTPAVSAVAMLSLALGIGANVTIFSLVNALMLKALPVHEPDRLVLLAQPASDGYRQVRTAFTNPQFEYIRDHQDFRAAVETDGESAGRGRPVAGRRR